MKQNRELLLVHIHRYLAGAEQMESVQFDIDIMKKVLTEHSETLQKIP